LFANTVSAEVAQAMRDVACTPEQMSSHLDYRKLAEKVAVDEVARYVDIVRLSDIVADNVEIDSSDIATRVARNLDMDDVASHVADEIDMGQVCEQCAEKIEVDEDAVVERAAEIAAENVDNDEVAAKVAENIDWEADVLDYETLAKALLACFAKSVTKS